MFWLVGTAMSLILSLVLLVVKCAMTKVSRELMVGLKRCPDQSSNIVTIII